MMLRGLTGDRSQEAKNESDIFYTTQDIHESFNKIEEEVAKWRQEDKKKRANNGGLTSGIRKIFTGKSSSERFVAKEKNAPRLLSLTDSSGPIHFEFTEVEGGGTVVKATYNPNLKGRMIKLKVTLPLKIPATPIGLNCPSCGKPVLQQFNMCPYCGTKLIKG
jgi:hypothetical protein